MALAERLAKHRELKTLVIDIERLPGRAELPFWTLNDYKNRRIHHERVTQWPRTICAAWRWFGEKKIHFSAEWEDGGPYGFAQTLRDAVHEADIITGHNVNRFDRRHWNSLFRDHNLLVPAPYKVIDTLTVARRELGDESLTLDALCKRYGIPNKEGRYNADVAQAAVDGVKKFQREIRLYNMADVEASTGLYTVMLPLMKGHPHVAPVRGTVDLACPRCGSRHLQRDGVWSPSVYVYQRFLCQDCHSWLAQNLESRGPGTRSL